MKIPSPAELFVAAAVAATILLIGGCAAKHSSNSQSAPAQPGITYSYHLRGIIKALPAAGELPASVSIKVPPIAHWVGMSGKIEPMMTMTMSYQLASGVTLHGIATGDKVAFTYKVNWNADRMVITRIKKLPAKTIINFLVPADAQASQSNKIVQ